jgi:hypothetical protein
MIISGWGIFLIFDADQTVVQTLAPYPTFGLATITVLNIAAYLMLLGIYNSATLVSLRKSIRKHALESRLLNLIGHAEMENEIQRSVKKIAQYKDSLDIDTEQQQPIELDEKELKKYVDLVLSKKEGRLTYIKKIFLDK